MTDMTDMTDMTYMTDMTDMTQLSCVRDLSDEKLVERLGELVSEQRGIEAELLAHLAEVDRRRLYLDRACASSFSYCTEVLHMSEDMAYRRIHAARAARAYPAILEMLARGELHLTGVSKLAPHLTEDNHVDLLSRAKHLTKRQIEKLLAEQFPLADVPTSIRKLPQPRQPRDDDANAGPGPVGSSQVATLSAPAAGTEPLLSASPRAASAALVAPIAPERYKVQFTASDALRAKIEEARDLLSHQVPDRDLATVSERAFDALLRDLKRKKFGLVRSPRPEGKASQRRTRHIPNWVKRAVVARDEARCTFVDDSGRRCSCTSQLEFHHEVPYGGGGRNTADNIRLLCRQHNAHLARRDYGESGCYQAQEPGPTWPGPS